MASRKKKNGSKKKKNVVSSQDELVTRFSQMRLTKRAKGSNNPLAGLPMVAKFHIKKAIALMEELEEKPGDLSIGQQLCSARCELRMITPCLKSCGFLSKDWTFDNMDLPSLRFLVG